MNDESNREWWQHPLVAAAALLSISWSISSIASCGASHDDAYYKAKVENTKDRIEYDKWLLENSHIEEPRLR